MTSPDSAEPNPGGVELYIPDNLAEFEVIEESDYTDTLTRLNGEVERVEDLGADNQHNESLCSFDDDGEHNIAWFKAYPVTNLLKTYRVVANREISSPDGSRILLIDDYIFAPQFETISRQGTIVTRDDAKGVWNIHAIAGPVLYKHHDHLKPLPGSSYTLNLPDAKLPESLSDKIARRANMKDLVYILGKMTEVTKDTQLSSE